MLIFFSYILIIVCSRIKFLHVPLGSLILKTSLTFFTILVVITEQLSLFKKLNFTSLLFFWVSTCVVCLVYLFKNRNLISFDKLKKKITFYFSKLKLIEKLFIFFIAGIVLSYLFQGIIYPPNNWDSLTYHMSRIMHWIGNESVAHYPTPTLRQLYQPPFAEYFILHVNLLNGNDYFSNSIQLFFLILSGLVVWDILNFFGISRLLKIIAVLLLITIPSVELQSSTTKNDIVCGFFVLATLLLTIKTYYDSTFKNFLFLALAIGLGLFTKGTAYLFLAPLLLFFSVFMLKKMVLTKNYTIITYGVLTILFALLLNAGHYNRNYQINKDILNIDETESKMYSNVHMNGTLLMSNLIKNSGLHLGYPIFNTSDALIKKFHSRAGIDINNPDTNYFGMPYQVSQELITHEDGVCNTTHFLLICFALVAFTFLIILKPKQNTRLTLLVLVLIIQAILFAGYLKWQPWHTRLHIPMFMLSVLIIIVIAEKLKLFRYLVFLSIPFLFFSFYFYLVYNNLRPITPNFKLTKSINLGDSRFKKYFSNQPQLYEDYTKVLNVMYSNNLSKVGLIISDWEYPLFHECYYSNVTLLSINVDNKTNNIPQNTENIEAIISSKKNNAFLELNGVKYKNQTPNNEYIWFYK